MTTSARCRGWLSDSLCRLATGGGFATRTLYSNKEQSVIYAQRPIVLNGIDEFVRKADLADRAVFLHPPTILDINRREEKEFWQSFRQIQPGILGALWIWSPRDFASCRPCDWRRCREWPISPGSGRLWDVGLGGLTGDSSRHISITAVWRLFPSSRSHHWE